MRLICLFLGILFFSGSALAQLSVKGLVHDDKGAAMPAATIECFGTDQDVKNTVADTAGRFVLAGLATGNDYLLQIAAVGFATKVFKLRTTKDTLIIVRLQPEHLVLDNITVKSSTKFIDIKPDKTTVNLADNYTIAGNSIIEALGRIPGVQVGNDQVAIQGRGAVKIMRDGRLVQLPEKELFNYLKSIPVGNVSKIEVISNPSAVYDAAGNAGIINIITKKNKGQGYSGSMQAGYRQWQEFPGMDLSGNIGYNSGKWTWYANGDLFRSRHKYGFRWEEYYPDRSWIMSDTGDYKWRNAGINAGGDYQLSKRSNIGVDLSYSRYKEEGADYVRNHFYNATGQVDSLLTTYADYIPVAKSQSYALYYKTRFDTTGTNFSVDGSYFNYYRTDKSNFTGRTFLPDGQPVSASTARFFYTALQHINIYALRADMELPTRFARLQFGGKINFIDIYSNTFYDRVTDQGRVPDNDLSIEYRYRENTQALYAQAIKEHHKWSFQAGLRAEITGTIGKSLVTSTSVGNDYIKLFPNALISYKPDAINNYSLTYSKRINRPTFWNLNPFKSLLTAYSYYEGNPYLQPEYISNFQLQHIYKNKLTSGLFLTQTNNGFADITIARVDTDFVMRTPRNFVNSTRIGLAETYSFSALKWWESNNAFNIYYTKGISSLSYIKNAQGWGAYFATTNNFYFNKNKTVAATVNFWYQFSDITMVNRSDPYYNLDLGLNTVLVRDKLSLSFNAQDVFASSQPTYTNMVNNIRQKYATLQLNRIFLFTLTFKFGKKEATAAEHTRSNDEERKRL